MRVNPGFRGAQMSVAGCEDRWTRRSSGLQSSSIRHGHGAQRHALVRRELLARALELTAGGEDVAAARRPYRRRIAGVEYDLGKLFDRVPVRAFVAGAGPGIEGDQIDLGRNALQQPDQSLG